jgi:hypothetical protein
LSSALLISAKKAAVGTVTKAQYHRPLQEKKASARSRNRCIKRDLPNAEKKTYIKMRHGHTPSHTLTGERLWGRKSADDRPFCSSIQALPDGLPRGTQSVIGTLSPSEQQQVIVTTRQDVRRPQDEAREHIFPHLDECVAMKERTC